MYNELLAFFHRLHGWNCGKYLAICTTISYFHPNLCSFQSHLVFVAVSLSHSSFSIGFLVVVSVPHQPDNCISNLMFCCKRSFWRYFYMRPLLCYVVLQQTTTTFERNQMKGKRERNEIGDRVHRNFVFSQHFRLT